eukprot:m.498934 g.498934  ORF g.498934 m.498934 type:complete len:853 (+) comp55732_c0_seq1:139-2697(+)
MGARGLDAGGDDGGVFLPHSVRSQPLPSGDSRACGTMSFRRLWVQIRHGHSGVLPRTVHTVLCAALLFLVALAIMTGLGALGQMIATGHLEECPVMPESTATKLQHNGLIRAVSSHLTRRRRAVSGSRLLSRGAEINTVADLARSQVPCELLPERVIARLASETLSIDPEQSSHLRLCERLLELSKQPCGSSQLAHLREHLLEEKRFQTTAFRLYLRARAVERLVEDNAVCKAGFGGNSTFAGAGSFGFAYAMCLGHDCNKGSRAIVKLATIRDTEFDANTHPVDMPLTPESATLQHLSKLIANNSVPHVVFGYFDRVCPELMATSLLLTSHACNEVLKKDRFDYDDYPGMLEEWAKCDAQHEIMRGHVSNSAVVMVQEEADLSILEMAELLTRDTFTDTQRTEIWKGILFQVAATLATLQRLVPGFRHNDMCWTNVRTTMPRDVYFDRRDSRNQKQNIRRWGSVEAPVDAKGNPTTHVEFNVDGQKYFVPNYGFQLRLGDFDFASAEVAPLDSNPKVAAMGEAPCAVPLPDSEEPVCTTIRDVSVSSSGKVAVVVEAVQDAARIFRQDDIVTVAIQDNGLVWDNLYRATPVTQTGRLWELELMPSPSEHDTLRSKDRIKQDAIHSGEACFLVTPWLPIDTSQNIQYHGDDDEEPHFELTIPDYPQDWVPGTLLAVMESPQLAPGFYRVRKIRSGSVVLHSIFHGHGESETSVVKGGYVVRVGQGSSRQYYNFAKKGISPIKNDKFDLHYFYNLLWSRSHFFATAFPQKVRGFLESTLIPEARGEENTLTHKAHLSDSGNFAWCHNAGAVEEDDPRIAKLYTAKAALGLPFFSSFHTPLDDSKRVLEPVVVS